MAGQRSGSPKGLEDNLKKAVTEMLLLTLLDQEDMYATQMTQKLEEKSANELSIVFPYAALYRLIETGCIWEAYKKNAPDGRRRQYYQITELGRQYLRQLDPLYRRFNKAVLRMLDGNTGETAHTEAQSTDTPSTEEQTTQHSPGED